jgi:hypothetical protein
MTDIQPNLFGEVTSGPKVVHCKRAPAGSFHYCGRPDPLGNPFPLKDPKDPVQRAACLAKYETWFQRQIEHSYEFRAAVESVRGQDLGCWCAPRDCHCDTILRWLSTHPAAYPFPGTE